MFAVTESPSRAQRYAIAARKLHDYLQNRVDPIAGFPDKPSWGYAFSILLSAAIGNGQFTELGERALHHLRNQDHNHPNYSWEFVAYAVQQAKRLLKLNRPLPCDIHRSKGTRMFNWFLLRQINRGWFDCRNRGWTLLKLRVALKLYQNPEGQILDEFRTRSFQYHAFCLFLICELIDQYPGAIFLHRALQEGVRFSASKVLADGTALWIGRGQEQIFGYGALVYALEYAHRHFKSLEDASILDRVQQHLLGFQRTDGSFPLVLRRRDPEAPDANFSDRPLGWYGYNTLYDYQPFLGYLLWRTSQLEGKA